MKNTNKILAWLLIWLLTIGNVAANWFPDEPMVLYGNITWSNTEGKNLKISDWENKLLKEIKVSAAKYGTNKTLDINNKISLNPYVWALKFQMDGYTFWWMTEWAWTTCEKEASFQKWNICEYNLAFNEIIISKSSWGGWSGGWGGWSSSSSSSSNNTIKTEISNDSTKQESNTNNSDSQEENNSKQESTNKVARNEEWKIIIKWTDYIKTIRNFNSERKEEKIVFWYKILNIKWNNSYNKAVKNYTKTIYKDIKIDWIRKSMIKHMDSMTRTFWILLDKTLDDNLREIYTEKLKDDKEYFELKMKKLKRKDEIIRHVLNKREQNK